MYRIALINMPFAALHMPSLSLTQLKSVLDCKYGDRVSVDVIYLNHAFAGYLGVALYTDIAHSIVHQHSGLGDWFFRQSAFPETSDNTERYMRRYYPQGIEENQAFKRTIHRKRRGLDGFLDDLITKHELDRMDLIGFTSMFSQNVGCFAMARKLKQRNPKIVIVIGGANCESPQGEEICMRVKQLDFVFSGPALKSFPEFVGYRIEQRADACNSIRGVFSRANLPSPESDVAWETPDAPGPPGSLAPFGEELDLDVKVDLDYYPFLDTLKRNFPNNEIQPTLLFETSRGCWWAARAHCTFCGLNGAGMRYRAMTASNAIEQFEALFEYFPRCSSFQSVDNILPKDYLSEVLPHLNPPSEVSIFYEVRANLSERDLETLSKAGIRRIQPGIEALATSTLKLIRKGTTSFQNVLLLKNCVTHNVLPRWNLLVGFPGEQGEVYEKYARDLPSLIHLPPPEGAYPVRYDRYSPYFVEAARYKLDLVPYEFYELVYPFQKQALARMAYYFMDRNFAAEHFATMVEWIGRIREKVDQWRNRWDAERQTAPPQLCLRAGKPSLVVYDSRTSNVKEHQINNTDKEVLEALDKPTTLPALTRRLKNISAAAVENSVAYLRGRGLIFEDGERFLNLVFPKETSPAFWGLSGHSLRSVGGNAQKSGAAPLPAR